MSFKEKYEEIMENGDSTETFKSLINLIIDTLESLEEKVDSIV